MALAVEKSNYSPHGHEVTSPPSDDDQGETIRIVTEAVEQQLSPESRGRSAAGLRRRANRPIDCRRASKPPSSTLDASTSAFRARSTIGPMDDVS